MDNEVKHTADFYRLVAWVHARRKKIILISGVVVAVAAIIGIYVWRKNYNENLASESLAKLKLPAPSENVMAAAAEPYLKVANDFQGTVAGSRAVLMGGGILFEAGKFKDAQDQFERFLRDYGDSSLVTQASLGVAACLEAEGKTAEATTHYEDFVHRHAGDPISPQANSALARLYVAQNKPEKALDIYRTMAQANNPDSWSAEAGIQADELLRKYPNLRKPVAPMSPPGISQAPAKPALTLPKK